MLSFQKFIVFRLE